MHLISMQWYLDRLDKMCLEQQSNLYYNGFNNWLNNFNNWLNIFYKEV